ncbi:hypothetical protein ABBQ38_007911 [Trebouxia sp. C0009 RCD-2024]
MPLRIPQQQAACFGCSQAFLHIRCEHSNLRSWHPSRQHHPCHKNSRECRLLPMQAATPGQAGFKVAKGLLQDPEVCKLMYPFVPVNMRSPEGIQLLMSEPDVQDHLERMLQQALKGNIEVSEVLNVESSAQEAGIRPVELIQLVMADPELQKACEKPEVMSAVFQCAEDSSKMAEYEHDPDVKMVCARPLLV